MKNLLYILTFIACIIAFACNESSRQSFSSNQENDQTDSVPQFTRMKADSLKFRLTHHYSENYNFRVKADSLKLIQIESGYPQDTCTIYNGDLIVVAKILLTPNDTTDTVWVKVGRDQFTMGWIKESELIPNVVPDDILSETLSLMTDSRAVWMFALIAFGTTAFFVRRYRNRKLQILKFNEMDSFYPILFLILTALLSCTYASIQNFVPEYWQEFYYNPTLNPMQLPPIMSLLVTLVWAIVIVFIAVVDDVYNNFYVAPGIIYLGETLGLGMLVYLFFSWTTPIGIGYALLPLFIIILVWIYFRHIRCTFICGECGYRMFSDGHCRHCGTYNSKE